ncbi:MAG: hypothetical protein LUG56_03920 [Lachnospiraceae bacterium]|nr:hypothetical protein [Lachnospiraceae bacterium]
MDEKRLGRVRSFIEERGWKYSYSEEDGCGSIDFEYRGLAYHIWEFDDGKVTHMEISKKDFCASARGW